MLFKDLCRFNHIYLSSLSSVKNINAFNTNRFFVTYLNSWLWVSNCFKTKFSKKKCNTTLRTQLGLLMVLIKLTEIIILINYVNENSNSLDYNVTIITKKNFILKSTLGMSDTKIRLLVLKSLFFRKCPSFQCLVFKTQFTKIEMKIPKFICRNLRPSE